MLGMISHNDCLLHDPGKYHPDHAERLHAINNQIIMSGLDFVIRHFDAPLAAREELKKAHDPDYVDRVFEMAPSEGSVEIDGDTVMSKDTLAAALRAAGSGVMGVDLIMEKQANPVFCAIRPPGHHAEGDRPMGFCLFNNAVIAARQAQRLHGAERVAIVDWDVHHGNGTQAIVWDDPSILYASTHQMPLYPGTGAASETGCGNIFNAPLAAGSGGPEFEVAFGQRILPALTAFAPDLVIISAGFDAHWRDPLANINLQESDFAQATEWLMEIAARHSGGRIVSLLEGGYDLAGLSESTAAHVATLMTA